MMSDSPPSERQIYRNCLYHLRTLQRRGSPVWWAKIHGGPLQQAGLPDLSIVYRGIPVWVELKRPGGRLTKLQARTLQAIRAAGGVAEVAESAGELAELLERVRERKVHEANDLNGWLNEQA